jgi:hypothetical protein
MGFLDNYEAARARTDRWIATYPFGRIETEIMEFSAEKGYVLVKATGYRDADDLYPAGVDFAYGYQGAYVQNMKRWFVEDTVTSAILRVMQLIMGGAERTVRETMEQIDKLPAKVANAEPDYWNTKHSDFPSYKTREEAEAAGIPTLGIAIDTIKETLGSVQVAAAPLCSHGHMIWREGTSAKTNKGWGGYMCSEKVKARQCAPAWYMLGSDGQWRPQV